MTDYGVCMKKTRILGFRNGIPIVEAEILRPYTYEKDSYIVGFYCEWCDKIHEHVFDKKLCPDPELYVDIGGGHVNIGHRAAHCTNINSPLKKLATISMLS